jgi:hypothetical protein
LALGCVGQRFADPNHIGNHYILLSSGMALRSWVV